MEHTEQFYIGGKWVDPVSRNTLDVVDPATEEAIATIAIGDADDVDAAVAAARDAFESYSQTSREERLELFDRIIEGYKARWAEIGDLISREMGAPAALAQRAQAGAGYGHFATMRAALADFEFERQVGTTLLRARAGRRVRPDHAVELADEPDRVQGRAGARRRLHDGAEADARSRRSAPSCSPRSSTRPACPRACSTSSTATGPRSARALAAHPDIDMVSFTGSTRAGIEVARAPPPTR